MFCKSVNGKSRIVALLAVFTIVLSLTPLPCLAVLHGDVELLKTVALQHKANFESLMTWKGEAFEERLSTRGDNYDYMVRSKCTFAYDKSQNAARWNRQPQENRFVVDGKTPRDIQAIYNSAMVKGKYAYEYSALGQSNGKDVFHLIIDKRGLAGSWESWTFEPRYFFSGVGVGNPFGPRGRDPLHDRLMFMYDKCRDTPKFVWYVKRAGDLVTLEVSFGENNANSEEFVFDLSAGANLLKYHNNGPEYENVYEYKYEEISGVWVPKSFKHMNISQKDKGAGALRTSRSIQWSNSVVNVPFEEDEFTVEKLGVKPDDEVSNHMIATGGRRYRDYLSSPEMLKTLYPPESLVGKRLPSLERVGVELDPAELEEKRILGCFWDMNQRPSRRMVSELGKRAEELKEKRVAAVLVQASKVDEKALNEWVEEHKIAFPVGMIAADEKTVQFAWGVEALPWLILTDEHHTVQAEGFQLEELDEKITALEAKATAAEAAWDKKYSDPREFVKLDWKHGMPYEKARSLITKDKLPLLHEILEDKEYAGHWHKVARLIGYISNDANSVPVLLRYFERDDSWNWKGTEPYALGHERLSGKIDALQWIGKLGTDETETLLGKAVNRDGAAELAKAWLGDKLIPDSNTFGTMEDTVVFIRGRAAMGLVFMRKPVKIATVGYMLTREIKYSARKGKSTRLYDPLVSAMAYNDFIEDHDLESLFKLFGSPKRLKALIPYINKYRWQDDAKTSPQDGSPASENPK